MKGAYIKMNVPISKCTHGGWGHGEKNALGKFFLEKRHDLSHIHGCLKRH